MLNAQPVYRNTIAKPVQNSFVQWLMDMETARMESVIQAREYYDGVQDTQLTDRVRQFLQAKRDADFTVNYCPTVVNAKADRLKVTGFNADDIQKALYWDWWQKNRMDRTQGIVHLSAIRDADAFLLVEWDNEANMPRFYYEPVYAGSGMMVYYSDERRDEIEMASKTWQIRSGSGTGKKVRKNLYLPDRIEKYVGHSDIAYGNWQPYDEDDTTQIRPGKLGMAGVHWWTDTGTETGDPLGIPVVHFKNNDTGGAYGTSDLRNVIPVQDALNKAMVDLLGAMDANGFPLFAGYGFDWSTLEVGPGAIASVTKDAPGAKLEVLAGINPQGLLNVYNALVLEIARISGTPLSYFQASGQVAAEGTLKQQEITLISRVEKAQTDFGNGWEDAMKIGRRLHNAFSDDAPLDTDVLIESIWEQAETRNDKEHAETLVIKQSLGVSDEKLQEELGYTPDDIASFARAKRRKQAMGIRMMQPRLPGMEDEDNAQDMTQTENENTEQEAA